MDAVKMSIIFFFIRYGIVETDIGRSYIIYYAEIVLSK